MSNREGIRVVRVREERPRVGRWRATGAFVILGRNSGVFILLFLLVLSSGAIFAQKPTEEIDDLTGEYQFLSPHDTLALLDQEGKLNGYVDVLQGEDESDDVLSYQITVGSRKGQRVEFKTSTIHRKYYRFAGTVERGSGREEGDPDYLRLVGELQIITVLGDTGEESAQGLQVVFKSLGQAAQEEGEEQD